MSHKRCIEEKWTLAQRMIYEIKKLVPIMVIVAASIALMLVDTNLWPFRWIKEVPQLVLALLSLSVTVFVMGALNVVRTWLMPSLHFTSLIESVEKEKNMAASVLLAAVFAFLAFVLWVTIGHTAMLCPEQTVEKAKPYIVIMDETFYRYWPDAPMKYIEPGKLDRETACPNPKKCWNPKVELKTSREWGIGLSQVTIAYNADGTERFNNWKEAKRKYKEVLGQWQWEDRYNPKMHIIYSILEDKSNYGRMRIIFKNTVDRWAGTLVSYNAGAGRVNNRRAICKITDGCDPGKWFGGLDGVASPSEKKLIYGVSLRERVNSYPYDVIFNRSKKYQGVI